MLAMQGAIASKRALAPDERPKRLREGWASRSDVRMARGAWMRRSGDAPERPIRHPLSAIPFLHVAARELQERRPVRAWRVTAAVLAERNLAIDQLCFDRRKLGRPEIALT